ncbi:MAG: hypothetical protein HYR94_13265 [Chloroflexi bacterium]|nr:hypothetical protein [Chloroflexota bacterium]
MTTQSVVTSLSEAFAQADTRQQEAIHVHHVQIATAKAAELELRQWYRDARQLVRVAIEQSSSNDTSQLRELLAV